MRKMIFDKTQNVFIQFIRYIFVGGFSALIDTGCLFLLNAHLGFNYLSAAAIGFLLGLFTNYIISVAWIFESSGKIKEEFILFSVIGVGGLMWTELILWVCVDFAHFPVLLAKGIALGLVLVWNFGMRKRFVFTPIQSSTENPSKTA